MRLTSILIAFFLTGCAGLAGVMGAHVNAYPGKERPIGEVAVLLDGASVAKVDAKRVGDNLIQGYPSDVRVLPGEHLITIDCMITIDRRIPTEVRVLVEAGHFYNMLCRDQGGGLFAGDMKDLGTQDPREKAK
jgi:hypothetical protein